MKVKAQTKLVNRKMDAYDGGRNEWVKVGFYQWIRTRDLCRVGLSNRCSDISKDGTINTSIGSGCPNIGLRTNPVVPDRLISVQLFGSKTLKGGKDATKETKTLTTNEYRCPAYI